MAILTTGDLTIPKEILNPWIKQVSEGSVISTLSNQTPMKFGKGEAFVFNIGEAEYVGEGAPKGASTVTKTSQTTDPFKFHKTVRWNEEVQWADEDHQLGVVQEILNLIQPSLSRALDFGIIHGINPTGGATVAAMTQRLINTTKSVEIAAAAPYTYIDAADNLLLADGFVPSDIALDPKFTGGFATLRDTNGRKLYPDLNMGTGISTLEGHRAATSRTVGATGVAAVDTKLRAIVGDFTAVRWGIQKVLGLEVIKYGDPDGQGDLKRQNQIAFRAEVVYGWGIGDLGAFAKIVDAV
jgi:HK97 family phage major capsid protein